MFVNPVCVKRCGGRDNDCECYQIGECHSYIGIETNTFHCVRPLIGCLYQRLPLGVRTDVLDLLRSLPEKQVRANGCSENSDDGRPERSVWRKRRNKKSSNCIRPRNFYDHDCAKIGKQRQRKPFQYDTYREYSMKTCRIAQNTPKKIT